MGILESFLLGVAEGVTEFLPISSTGHLILASKLLGIPNSNFVKTFEIAIQLGAILAVVVLYFRSFFDLEICKRLLAAFLPTGLIGFAAYPFVKSYLLESEHTVLVALLLGGIALIVFEMLYREGDQTISSLPSMTYKQAIFVGFFQSLAIIPGVSRSAATILGGLLASGMDRKTIIEFSFLLAVPTMLAAAGYDVLKNLHLFTITELQPLAIGFVTSFLVALGAIKFLLAYIRTHSFIPFGIYRIAIAVAFLVFIL